MFAPCYLDHNATTRPDPRVLEAMLPYLGGRFGNASSRHEYGRRARAAIDEARARVAAAVGAHPSEVLFVSGGSEANNLFIKGAAAAFRPGLLAISAIEHPCVREPARQLARDGWQLHEIAVDASGQIEADDFEATLARAPRIVSVMLANNETGVVNDVAALAARAKAAKAWFHTDAVQALGKLRIDFRELGVNALSLSAHKLYGPLGSGALVVDKRVDLRPLIAGGGQERDLRSGTENLPAIVGFGLACELAAAGLEEAAARVLVLRRKIEAGVSAMGAEIFSRAAPRLPNTVFFALPGVDGETLVAQLDRAGFACASGSACSSVSPEPSHSLLAMGVDAQVARGALRVSLGRDNTIDEIERFLETLEATVFRLKQMTAVAV